MSKKTTVLLGTINTAIPRNKTHQRRVSTLITQLTERTVKRVSIVPKIFKDEELHNADRIVINGENAWTDSMEKYIVQEFSDCTVEHVNDQRTEIYVPVRREGIMTSSPRIDLLANLSVLGLCVYLLYYLLIQ